MPVPALEEWLRRWERPILRRLGIRGEEIEHGYARFVVERPEDADDLLHRSAVTIAADMAAISAVTAQLDEAHHATNGTAELHLSFTAPLAAVTRVTAQVVHWADYAAHLEIEVHDGAGDLLAKGLTTYSLRPLRSKRPAR